MLGVYLATTAQLKWLGLRIWVRNYYTLRSAQSRMPDFANTCCLHTNPVPWQPMPRQTCVYTYSLAQLLPCTSNPLCHCGITSSWYLWFNISLSSAVLQRNMMSSHQALLCRAPPLVVRTCHAALVGVGWRHLAHVSTAVVVVTLPSLRHRRVVSQPHPLRDQAPDT